MFSFLPVVSAGAQAVTPPPVVFESDVGKHIKATPVGSLSNRCWVIGVNTLLPFKDKE